MSFPAYPEYKDSGVQWLGEIPAHWSVVSLKRIGHLESGDFISPDDVEDTGDYPVIGGNGRRGFTSSYTHEGVFPVIGRQGALCGNINYAEGKFWASEHAVVVTPGIHVEPIWLGEILRTMHLNQYSVSAAQPGLAVERVKSLPVAYPPSSEQAAISRFLTYESARIDALIEEQRRLIELLKEKRQAVISHAVTKGLDPDVPMKDSGVEWLGEVPAHWGVLPLRRLVAGIEQGWSPEADNNPATTDQWGVIKLSAVSRGRFYPEENKAIPEDQPSRPGLRIKKGDLLVTRANTPELVGDVAFVEEAPNNLILCDLCYRLDTCDDRVDRRFLRYVMLSDHMRAQVSSDARGSSGSMVKISHGMIKSWLIPVPPLDEQKRIAQRIAEELSALASTQEAATQLVERLRERRSALISAAVTGKIDVRDWQPPAGEDELRTTAHEDAEA